MSVPRVVKMGAEAVVQDVHQRVVLAVTHVHLDVQMVAVPVVAKGVHRVQPTVVRGVGRIARQYVVTVRVDRHALQDVPMHARDLVRSHARVLVREHVSLIVRVAQDAPVLVKVLATVHVAMLVLLNVVVRVKLTVPAHVQVVTHNVQMHVLADVMVVHLHAVDFVREHVAKAA